MKLATWNINSIRVRQERLVAWLKKHDPDVLCLQEIKCEDELFPSLELRQLGYHSAVYGQRSYNGVAIVAKHELCEVVCGFADDEPEDPQARVIAASVGGLRVVCVYVPNGHDVTSDKYAYKLAWLERLQRYVDRINGAEPIVLCGDFNICPDDRDVSDLHLWQDGIFTSTQVRAAIAEFQKKGLVDVFRKFNESGGVFSWWDYRQLSFPKNKGLRIDLILAQQSLSHQATACFIDRDERKGKQPSDHAPVVVEF